MTREAALADLSSEERMLLMRFVCSFAWADLKITAEERSLGARLIARLDLDEEERRQVQEWLKLPPAPDSVDPADVPHRFRVQFLRAMETMVSIDGEVTDEEREAVIIFAQLTR